MHHADRRSNLRRLLDGDHCLEPASVFDPISIRLAERLGYEFAMLGGSVVSLAVLGAPDLTLVTLSELAEQVRRICRASTLPLFVDADHGFGNALNVMRTVAELEDAGAAGLAIEDTKLPLPFGVEAPPLISVAEAVGKIGAAIAGRTDPTLVVAARTSVSHHADADETRERVRAYQDAGADALFVVGLRTRTELAAIASDLRVPMIVAGVSGMLSNLDILADHNVSVFVGGHYPIEAAIAATHRALQEQRDGGRQSDMSQSHQSLMDEISRGVEYRQWSESFLRH